MLPRTAAKRKICKVGRACGLGCVPKSHNCKRPLRHQAKTAVQWLAHVTANPNYEAEVNARTDKRLEQINRKIKSRYGQVSESDKIKGDRGGSTSKSKMNSELSLLIKEVIDRVKQDSIYLSLSKGKKVEAMQEMVKNQAKRDGYNIENAYHGTKSIFNVFDQKKTGVSDPGLVGSAFYFTPEKDQAESFAKSSQYGKGQSPRVISAVLKLDNPMIIKNGVLPNGERLRDVHPNGITKASGASINRKIKKANHDGVIFLMGDSTTQLAVFNPNQIKLSDPIAYDDRGNIIPLSKRFDSTVADIRGNTDPTPPIAVTKKLNKAKAIAEKAGDKSILDFLDKLSGRIKGAYGGDFSLLPSIVAELEKL